MDIRTADYFLIRFCQRFEPLLRRAGNWETRHLAERLEAVPLEKPVFITGLARSGTTLLLELLATIDGAATHRYRDFPFLAIPYFWNQYLNRFPVQQQPVERAHKDRIFVTRENPEAMEEPLWHAFFPRVHSATALHRLTPDDADPKFESFYTAHLRKILLIRDGHRYVAKGNYHIPRIEYLAQLLPDARFVIPVREPLAHIHSLVRQHELFSSYAASDPRVPRYLEAAGHFEFGPQRVPIRLDRVEGDRILDAWAQGNEYLGYAIQWKELYGFVNSLLQSRPDLASRILLVRYEDLCSLPRETLGRILDHIDVDPKDAARTFERLDGISKSPHVPELPDNQRSAVWAEVAAIAATYGYPDK